MSNIYSNLDFHSRLFYIYKDAEKGTISETTRDEINKLPSEIAQKIFSHICDLNGNPSEPDYGQVHLIENPSKLHTAIHKVCQEHFQRVFVELFDLFEKSFDKNNFLDDSIASFIAKTQILTNLNRKDMLKDLPIVFQEEIYLNIRDLNCKPNEDEFGRNHVFYNPILFREVIQKMIVRLYTQFYSCSDSKELSFEDVAMKFLKQQFQSDVYENSFQFAKHCAKRFPYLTVATFQHFNIENEEERANFIFDFLNTRSANSFVLKTNYFQSNILPNNLRVDLIASNIENFKIEDQGKLALIAKRCFEENLSNHLQESSTCYGTETIKFIQSFNIHDEKIRIEIARDCAKTNPKGIASNIHLFDIKNEDALFEIVELCCKQNRNSMPNFYLPYFHENRFRLAKICAQYCPFATARSFENFNIEEESQRIEIAKICAEKDALMAQYIGNFQIKNKSALLEIAHLCAKTYPAAIIPHIGKFHVENLNDRVALAKVCAEEIDILIPCLDHFEINDPATILEIIELGIKFNGEIVASYIQQLPIKKQEDLIRIAKACASKTARTAQHIQNFGIQDQDALIEIAKICAKDNGPITAEHIAKFKIENQGALLQIAHLCIESELPESNRYGAFLGNPDLGTVDFLNNFNIQNENSLVELLKHCAEKTAKLVAISISKYQIKEEANRIEIAKLCAKQAPDTTACHFQNFNIQDETACLEIAKICVISSEEDLMHIDNIPIEKEEDRIELAWMVARLNPRHILSHLSKIQNENEIALLAFCYFISSLGSYHFASRDLKSHKLKEIHKALEINEIQHLSSSKDVLTIQNYIFKKYQTALESALPQGSPLIVAAMQQIQGLSDINEIYPLVLKVLWVQATLFFFLAALDPEQQRHFVQSKILENLMNIQAPNLRNDLTKLLIPFAKSDDAFKSYAENTSIKQSREGQVLDFILQSLQTLGIPKELADQVKTTFYPVFKGHAEIRPLLETLNLLQQSPHLEPLQKIKILQSLCRLPPRLKLEENGNKPEKNSQYNNRIKPEMRNRVFALLTLLLFKEENRLIGNEMPILDVSKAVLQEKLHMNNSNDTFQRFQKCFLSPREPNSMITYTAKLSSLNEPAVMEDLGRYVASVLNDNFLQERCNLEKKPHLAAISNYDPHLIGKWIASLEGRTAVFLAEIENPFEPKSWIRTKLEIDHHIEANCVPHLAELLNEGEIEEGTLTPLEMDLKLLLVSKTKEEQIKALEKIKTTLKSLPPCEFASDVNGTLEALKKPVLNQSSKVRIVDSDDYLDLLLSGTEVVGSCQNVNGSPHNNKGLLGYLLDGKNRLIAVKDERGRIIARAKLSLLWDGQRPALYLERLYSSMTFTQQSQTAITEMAVAKAASLGLPLVAMKGGNYPVQSETWNTKLYSLGGGVSYEYSDAARGVQAKGIYEIAPETVGIIWCPPDL